MTVDIEQTHPQDGESDPAGELLAAPGRRSNRRLPSPTVAAVAVFLVGLIVWELIARAEWVAPIILPAPSAIWSAAVQMLGSGTLWRHLADSALASVIGFAVGSVLGFALGLPLGASDYVRRVFSPFIVVFQTIPKVTLAPLFVVAFGFGLSSKVVMASLVCFFPVFVNTVSGLTFLDPRAVNLMRSLGAKRWGILRRLALPSALPSVFAGLKSATTLAVIGVVVSELVGSSRGLGFLIALNTFQLRTATVYVLIGAYGLLGWLMYAVVDAIGNRVLFWQVGSDTWRGAR